MFNRWVETDGLLDALEAKAIGAIVFSPLAQGMLTDKYLERRSRRQPRGDGGFLRAEVAHARERRARSARSTRWPGAAASRSPRWRSPGSCATRG